MPKLHEYQKRAAQFIVDTPRVAVWMSVGLGKSATTLEAIKSFTGKTIIVAPKRVIETVWKAENQKWRCGFTFSRIVGTPKQRLKALEVDADIHLISYDLLVWLRQYYDKKWPYSNVVLDESSMTKTPGSKRSRAALWISNRPNVKRVVELTATPASNGLLNLYMQIKILDGGKRLGRSMEGYKRKYFYPTDYMRYNWAVQPGKEKAIYNAVDDITISLSADDYLELPEKVINDIYIDLPAPALRDYKELKKEMYLEIKNGEIEAPSAAVLVAKLAQVSSGAVYLDGKEWEEVHTAKLDALGDIIEESSGNPVLVAYNYIHSRERIRERFGAFDIKDGNIEEVVAAWNAGEIPLMMAQYRSAAHGLNLQEGPSSMVLFDQVWDMEVYEQMIGRIHRQGRKFPVIISRLLAVETVDEDIVARLESKDSIQQLLLEALKQ